MPLYDYQCSNCGAHTEVRHGFDQRHEAPCEKCGGALRRVFNPAPILFKGSGFYVTDSRKSSAPAEKKPDAAPKGEKTEKSESTAAPAKESAA